MEVELVKPQGYCIGVTKAIELAYKAKEENPYSKIYVLGMLVHNKHVTKQLDRDEILTLDDEDPIKSLRSLDKGDVIVFSAHGHDEKIEEFALKKGLIVYDATCPRVKYNLELIKKEIRDGHQIIYIGQTGHKETCAALSVSQNVSLYDTKLLFNYHLITDFSPLVINQTTLNFTELKLIHEDIKKHIPGARIENEICNATRARQEGILKISKDTDLIVIVGDNRSSNTTKLYDIARNNYVNALTVLVNDLDELRRYNLSKYKKAAISSGASTPYILVEEIKDYLLSL